MRTICCGVVWLMLVSVSLAQFGGSLGDLGSSAPTKSAKTDSDERTKKIEASLQKEAAFDFVETPLQEAVEFIAEKYDLPIRLDTRSLEEYGYGSDEPITASVKMVRLSNALDLMLKPLDLAWTIDHGYVQVTSVETAEYTLRTEIYDVKNLVAASDEGAAIVYSTDAPSGGYEQLLSLVTRTVRPESWEEMGGVGTMAPFAAGEKKLLVVSQSYAAHREIADLLSELERRIGGVEKVEAKTGSVTKLYPLVADSETPAAELVDLVKSAIETDSWKGENKIEAVAGVLVVKNNSSVHAQVKKMLMALDVLKSDPVLNQGYEGGFGYSGFGGGGGGGGGFGSSAGFQ